MLAYATISQFQRMIRLTKESYDAAEEHERKNVEDYLRRATRTIERYTRRRFLPWREARVFPVPYAYSDLRLKRYPAMDLYLNQDLLEVETLVDGQSNSLTEGTDYFLLDHNIYPKYAIALKFPNYWNGGFSTSTLSHVEQPEVTLTGVWGFSDESRYPAQAWIDTLEVVPTGALTSSETTITLDGAAPDVDGDDELGEQRLDAGYLLRIDDEFIEVLSVDETTNAFDVRRGAQGTTATAHTAGTTITRWRVPEDITETCLKIAKTWREADELTGGRLGVGDMSVGIDLDIPNDAKTTIKYYTRRIAANWR